MAEVKLLITGHILDRLIRASDIANALDDGVIIEVEGVEYVVPPNVDIDEGYRIIKRSLKPPQDGVVKLPQAIGTIDKIKKWVVDRGLHTQDPRIQLGKLMEEVGELAKAVNKQCKEDQIDGIGDVFVVLVCLSIQLGWDINNCINSAYNEIRDRKGRLIDGIFVKDDGDLEHNSK